LLWGLTVRVKLFIAGTVTQGMCFCCKSKAEEEFCMIALLFTFCEKITSTEVTHVSKVLDHTLYQNLQVSGAAVAPTSHFCTSAVMDCG